MGSGERVGEATQAPAPCYTSESPNWLGEVPAQQLKDAPEPRLHIYNGGMPQAPEACPPFLWGGGKVGPMEAQMGRNPQASSWSGQGVRAEEGGGAPCRTGDIGGRAAGQRVFRYQILKAGTGPESQGSGQGQSPWWGRGALALAQVPGPKAGAECHQSCWHSILPALGPVPGGGGQRPQYGLRPEGEQRTARAGSLQRRRPRGRQPLPQFLCLWHCPGVRIYSHFSQE